MSHTRRRVKTKSLKKLLELYPEVLSGKVPDIEFVARIPWCYGGTKTPYRNQTTFDDIEAMIATAKEGGFDIRVYVEPRDEKAKLEWHSAFQEWVTANPNSCLSSLPKKNIIQLLDWRKTERWLIAKQRHNELRSSVDKQNTIDDLLKKDVENYQKSHKASTANTQGAEDVAAHILDTLYDYISWMSEAPSKKVDQIHGLPAECKRVSLLMYPYNATQLMRNASLNARTMGYQADSIIHLKIEFENAHLAACTPPPLPAPSSAATNVEPRIEMPSMTFLDPPLKVKDIYEGILADVQHLYQTGNMTGARAREWCAVITGDMRRKQLQMKKLQVEHEMLERQRRILEIEQQAMELAGQLAETLRLPPSDISSPSPPFDSFSLYESPMTPQAGLFSKAGFFSSTARAGAPASPPLAPVRSGSPALSKNNSSDD